jgi:CSLREA domain-containing protein
MTFTTNLLSRFHPLLSRVARAMPPRRRWVAPIVCVLAMSAHAAAQGTVPVTINQADEQGDPAYQEPIFFTVVFAEPVFGFETGDVLLSGTAGATTATVTDTGDNMIYQVAVTGMTSNGTVIANVPAGVATNENGDPNEQSTSEDNTVTFAGLTGRFVVTKTADTNDGACDADCSLREAITASNSQIGTDIIVFNIPASDPGRDATTGVFTITLNPLLGSLPAIVETVTIDGYTQGTISTPADTSDVATRPFNQVLTIPRRSFSLF